MPFEYKAKRAKLCRARVKKFFYMWPKFRTTNKFAGRIYIFRNFNQYIIYKINENNNEEEKRSGTTGLGVSQKDLQINEKNNERKKNLKS